LELMPQEFEASQTTILEDSLNSLAKTLEPNLSVQAREKGWEKQERIKGAWLDLILIAASIRD
jgi:hypothetical protein